MTDHNTPEYLDKLREAVFEVLRDKNAAPSVQIHGEGLPIGTVWILNVAEVPKLAHDNDDDHAMEDEESKDVRKTRESRQWLRLDLISREAMG